MARKEKQVKVPLININHNDDDTGLVITVDLAGAAKESVGLDMGERGFCLKADAENFRYDNCFMLAHEVKPKETRAKFNSGLLTIRVPFKETSRGFKVAIE
jgi:HSP20 family molecular chaperone IbpA